jgi:mannose/fructose-specific phosphotransferase system component IIA
LSDAAPVRGILVGHGMMPAGMADAVQRITGEADAVVPVSNRGKSPDELTAEIELLVGDAPALVFTDLASGSCGLVARRLQKGLPQLVVISAVNLPVLIEFAMNRTAPLPELVPRLLRKGRAAIGCAPAELEDHGHTALPHR